MAELPGDRTDAAGICKIWQKVRNHRLTYARKRAFLARPEVLNLATFPTRVLLNAGQEALAREGGELLLTTWLDVAREMEVELIVERREFESHRERRQPRLQGDPCPA